MRTRVWAALLVTAVAVGGCSSDAEPEDSGLYDRTSSGAPTSEPTDAAPGTPGASPSPSPSASPSPSPSAEPTPSEPSPTPYLPDDAEVDAPAKRAAAKAVEALPEVAQVTYTQYFGYLPPRASILVEADFVDGSGTTYDVRISQADGRWQVDSVEPASRVRALSQPSSLIRRVLDSDRIELPWAGRRDVASGRVADSVLRSMLAVAEEHRIEISVLISAHPVNVFGTDRRSNHPDGLAYDIGSIDGRLVVDPRAAGLVREVMELAATTGAYQVGGPTDLDDGGGQYFADPTHSDHVHVGFDG